MSVFDSSMNSLLSDEESRSPQEDSLPGFELSLSSLDQSSHRIVVNATAKMWKTTIGNTDRPLLPGAWKSNLLDFQAALKDPGCGLTHSNE
jgi:hypothetical protein